MSSRSQTLIFGTRGSPLALAQSRQVARQLEALHPGWQVLERIITTTGDRQQGAPLPAIGGKGVFTLEIEQALLNGEIDFAVHSLKDLPPQFPDGLCLAAVPKRAPACDCLILHSRFAAQFTDFTLRDLPQNAKIGTSSLRRAAQLKWARPDLQTASVRGNVGTRLQKMERENFDAIVLARAGLERLEIVPASTLNLEQSEFVPAPGQGALALEARRDDQRTLQVLSAINHAPTCAETRAERACMEALNAGCSTPLGARALCEAGENGAASTLKLWAVVLAPDGAQRIFAEAQSTCSEAQALGGNVAAQLKAQGALELMR